MLEIKTNHLAKIYTLVNPYKINNFKCKGYMYQKNHCKMLEIRIVSS